jgi:hypothetical protein
MLRIDQFHEFFGGRRRQDFRFWDREAAVEIRQKMCDLKLRRELNLLEIAKLIDENRTSLSLAVGGRIGIRRLAEIKDKLGLI